ncbi:MAG TPA: hypothetical protein VFX30_09950 [bacterium]|nr:hypothetical protein [bacterium]
MGDPKIAKGQGSGQNAGGYLGKKEEMSLGLRCSLDPKDPVCSESKMQLGFSAFTSHLDGLNPLGLNGSEWSKRSGSYLGLMWPQSTAADAPDFEDIAASYKRLRGIATRFFSHIRER